jgi:hypothetical protein
MPPRYSYWTIIAGGLPTAFRAAEREELMPTFQRLREKHPDAEMKWFARGKLWESPEAARPPREYAERDARAPRGRDNRDRTRAPREDDRRHAPEARREGGDRGEHRGRDWRPGGEHRDPRQPFKDAKKARNQRWREEKFSRKQRDGEGRERPPREKPHGDPLRREAAPRFTPRDGERPRAPKGFPPDRDRRPDDRRARAPRPPKTDWQARPPREKPHGDPMRRDGAPRFTPRDGERPRGPKGWSRDRERRPDDRGARGPRPPKTDWQARPPREKPHGDPMRRDGAPRFTPRDGERPRGPKGFSRDGERRPDDRGARAPRPPKTDWQARPPREKPHGDPMRRDSAPRFTPRDGERARGPKGFSRDAERRPDDRGARAPRPPKTDWQARPPREKPHGDTFAHKPGGDVGRAPRGRDERDGGWRPRPPRETPQGGQSGGRDDWKDRPSPRKDRDRETERPKPGDSGERRGSPDKTDWRENLPRDSWRDAPREKPRGDKSGNAAGQRPFSARGGFDRKRGNEGEAGRAGRNQGTDAPDAPPRPRGPNREPRPSENPEPSPPPRPSEPAVPAPGPPERGRLIKKRRSEP